MAICSQAITTITGTTSSSSVAVVEYRSTGYSRPRLMELSLQTSIGIAVTYGLGRSATIGVNPVLQVFQTEDSLEPSPYVTSAIAWGQPPSIPANYFRRVNTASTGGSGIIWTFPRGIPISVSSNLALFAITSGTCTHVNAVFEE